MSIQSAPTTKARAPLTSPGLSEIQMEIMMVAEQLEHVWLGISMLQHITPQDEEQDVDNYAVTYVTRAMDNDIQRLSNTVDDLRRRFGIRTRAEMATCEIKGGAA